MAGTPYFKQNFPSDWQLDNAVITEEPKQQGTPVVRMEAKSRLTLEIVAPQSDRVMVVSVWLKGTEDNQWISSDTQARRSDGNRAQIRINVGDGYLTSEYARLSTGWKKYSKSIVVSRSAKKLVWTLSNNWKQPLFVAAPTIEVKGHDLCDLDGPGVLHARVQVWVKPQPGHKTGTVTFPVPLLYGDQVPLAMKLTSNQESDIAGYRFFQRPDGINWLCEVRVRPNAKGTAVGWEALVLARPHAAEPVRRASQPEVPPQTVQWLQGTPCVQTNSPLIIAKAKELHTDDIASYVRRVIEFTRDNRGSGGEWKKLDAETSLTCSGGGSCTNRANLAAALLRLRGIPARTVAHLPTWAYGDPLFTHWLVEYWHPGSGWISAESTWGEYQPPPYTTCIIAISSVADEKASFNKSQARWVLPGAPQWSFANIGDDLMPDAEQNQQTNWARPLQRFSGSPQMLKSLFVKASREFPAKLKSKHLADPERFERKRKAAESGQLPKE